MGKSIRIIVLAGFIVLIGGAAQAQGWYNYALPAQDSAGVSSQPVSTTYRGLFTGPGGELYAGSVHSYSMNLGSGVSMGLFSSVSDGPVGQLSGLPGSSFVPGFAGSATTNYANGLSLNPAVTTASNVSGRMSVNLGGGLSMDFLGGLSQGPNGYYFGPGYGLESRTSATVGAGFSMNLGHGGTLSVIGGVSNGFGSARACGPVFIAACR